MVNVKEQQAKAFGALAAAAQQQKYDAMFAAVPKYDGKNKEECAVWINRISSIAASTGRNLRLELLNRSEGDVMTIIAGMDDNVDDRRSQRRNHEMFLQCPNYKSSYWSAERNLSKTQ